MWIAIAIVVPILVFLVWRVTSVGRGARQRDRRIYAKLEGIARLLKGGQDVTQEQVNDAGNRHELRGMKYPQWKDPYEARLGSCDIKVEDSRLSGTVVVVVKTKDGKESEFSYKTEAILDGDDFAGYWHGMTGGKPVLNKSSKLYGKVVPAAAGQPAGK